MRKEFEKLPEIQAELENSDGELYWCDKQNQYRNNRVFQDSQTGWMNGAWYAWQAAKAQAVSEIQQALNDRLLVKSIREHVESHISEISVNDLFDKGWLAAMKCIQNNIDMLEAQEQTQ